MTLEIEQSCHCTSIRKLSHHFDFFTGSETGTPSFLIKLLQQRQQFTPDLTRIVASEALLSTFDVDNIPVESLMFQAGYLTIANHRLVLVQLCDPICR